jgi:hypothetical protein
MAVAATAELPCDTRCKKDIESCGLVLLMYAKFLRVGMPLSSISRLTHGCPHYRAHIGAVVEALKSSIVTG